MKKILFGVFLILSSLNFYGQRYGDHEFKKILDSASAVYKKNISGISIHEKKDSIITYVYYRKKPFEPQELLLITRKLKTPTSLTN